MMIAVFIGAITKNHLSVTGNRQLAENPVFEGWRLQLVKTKKPCAKLAQGLKIPLLFSTCLTWSNLL
jgi:hypothetical protein